MNSLEIQFRNLITSNEFKIWLSRLSKKDFDKVFKKLQFGQTGDYFPLSDYGKKLLNLRVLRNYSYKPHQITLKPR